MIRTWVVEKNNVRCHQIISMLVTADVFLLISYESSLA
mgnify:CR=1 FL=1